MKNKLNLFTSIQRQINKLNNLKDLLLETVEEYQKQHCDKNGNIKRQFITRTREKAIQEVKVYEYE